MLAKATHPGAKTVWGHTVAAPRAREGPGADFPGTQPWANRISVVCPSARGAQRRFPKPLALGRWDFSGLYQGPWGPMQIFPGPWERERGDLIQ